MITPAKVYAVIFLLIATAIAGLSFGYHQGAKDVHFAWNMDKLRTARELATAYERATVISNVVETKYIERVRVIYQQPRIITREVLKYVPIGSPDLPGGWRLLHDAAATGGALPDPASIADAGAVSAQDAATTVAENYATCRAAIEQVRAWQEWARGQGHRP